MNYDPPKVLSPLVLAIIFFVATVLLFLLYPTSFWRVTDNEPHGLGNAINMAYRLADHKMYPAPGITWHPGVTFYLINWLALALAGYPFATGGFDFFKAVIAHAEDYHKYIICLAAFIGAAGVYVFARSARALVPVGVVIIGLLLWLVSTPATIMMFMSPGFESFAILLNGLFLAVLVRIAYAPDVSWSSVVLAGSVGALAYLNKLSYIYILLALGAAISVKIVTCRAGWIRGAKLMTLFVIAFVSLVLAAAYFIIGWRGFQLVLEYHKSVILGSGLYGTGDQTVVSGDEVRKALQAILVDRTYAIPIAMIVGVGLAIVGLVTAFMTAKNSSVAVLCIGTGLAAALSAIVVLKHYEVHYTAGVSATLPACAVACYLLARAWSFRLRSAHATAATVALASMAYYVVPILTTYVVRSTQVRELTIADSKEINAQITGTSRIAEFTYRVPFAEFGEGFVLVIAGIPQLTEEYLRMSRRTISSFMARQIRPDVGIYVLDKGYFPNEDAVKSATNLDLPEASAPVVIKYEPGDKLIELRTVILLVRGR